MLDPRNLALQLKAFATEGRRTTARGGSYERAGGQALVEMTLLLPLLLTLVVGLLEFGMLFKDHMGIHYASREGARIGAAASKVGNADALILDVVSTTLQTMDYDQLQYVKIYRAGTDGQCADNPCSMDYYDRFPNGWNWEHGFGGSNDWPPSARNNCYIGCSQDDAIGVEVQYRHYFFFNYFPFFNTFVMVTDQTVTQIEPEKFRPVPP